ncbi:MAG: hypothetical protein L3J88_12885 [Gammaproteobacteria bacterium]|nr:hypothetical protein [Gammaproteobacteria bacterium]MCF6364209.1 hypothetical protein [Gammaproteobacteria bacterium]
MIPPPNVTGNTGIDGFLLGASAAISQIDGGTGANTLMGDKDFSTITAMTTTKRMSGLRGEGETTDR